MDATYLYQYLWLLNDNSVCTSQKMYLSESAAEIEAEKKKPLKESMTDTLILKIEKIPVNIPCATEIMKIVYVQKVKTAIEGKREKDCEGCKVQHPSQLEHMKINGCLNEENDLLSKYVEEARNEIKVIDLMQTFDELRLKLKVKPVFSQMLAQAAKAYLPSRLLEECIKEEYLCSELKIKHVANIVRELEIQFPIV